MEVDCPLPNPKSNDNGSMRIDNDCNGTCSNHLPTNILAQTDAMNSGNSCTTSQDRNKAALDDFFAIYKGSAKYTDSDFGPNNNALYWGDMGQG